jgi:hypothetical protein
LEQVVVELDEAIDFDSMRDAWQHVLKTIEFFQKESDQDRPPTPLQQPSTSLANPTIVVETQENFDLENLLKSERDRVSDLNEPPLRRVALLRYNDQRWSMIWTILPPAIDQRFIAIVLDQVFDAYEKILAAQPPTQFQPASMKERMRREQLNNPERVKTIQPMLEGPKTPLPLPLRTKTGVPLPHRIAEIRQDSPRKLLSRLRQCASETGVNMEVLAQFAWGILLRRYGAGRDVSFGGVRSGPQFIDVDNSLAPFSVKLPVRIQLDPDVTVRHALQSLQADHLELAKHPWTPLQDIQRGLTGGVRLFETEVTYEQISPKAESPKLERWARRRYWSRSQSTCLLSLMAQENKGTLLLGLRYDAGLYDPQTASQILDDYLHILGAIAKQLDQPLRDLDALSPAMRNL